MKNLHSMLMLHQSPWTGELVAYCDRDRRTAVKFIEGRGDFNSGSSLARTGGDAQESLTLSRYHEHIVRFSFEGWN